LTSGGKIVKAVINKSPQADKISANITALASNPQGAIELLLNNEVDAILLPQEVDVAQLKVIDIPADINQAIEIWAAVLSYTVNENEAKAFVEFIIGEEGRKVFQEMGFQVAEWFTIADLRFAIRPILPDLIQNRKSKIVNRKGSV